MKDLILPLDVFGYSPHSYFKGKDTINTLIGLILSMLIGITTVVFGVFFLRECTDRKKYSLVSSDVYLGNNGYELKNFNFTFAIKSGGNRPFPEWKRYFELQTYYARTSYQPKLETCNASERNTGYVTSNAHYDTDYFCFPSNVTNTLYRYGGGSYLGFLVKTCSNKTDVSGNIIQPACHPIDKIKKDLSVGDIFAFVNFIDYNINHTSRNHVFEPFINMMSMKLSLSILLRYQFKFQPVIYYIDEGYVLDKNEKYEGYYYAGTDTQIDMVTDSSIKFAQFDLVLFPTKRTFTRTYIKLQQVAANIGGVAKFLMVMGQILLMMYSKNQFFVELASEIYEKKLLQEYSITPLKPEIPKIQEKPSCLELQNVTEQKNINFESNKHQALRENVNENCYKIFNKNYAIGSSNIVYFKEKVNFNDIKTSSSLNSEDIKNKTNTLKFNLIYLLGVPNRKLKFIKDQISKILSLECIFANLIELVHMKDYLVKRYNLIYYGNGIELFDGCSHQERYFDNIDNLLKNRQIASPKLQNNYINQNQENRPKEIENVKSISGEKEFKIKTQN